MPVQNAAIPSLKIGGFGLGGPKPADKPKMGLGLGLDLTKAKNI